MAKQAPISVPILVRKIDEVKSLRDKSSCQVVQQEYELVRFYLQSVLDEVMERSYIEVPTD